MKKKIKKLFIKFIILMITYFFVIIFFSKKNKIEYINNVKLGKNNHYYYKLIEDNFNPNRNISPYNLNKKPKVIMYTFGGRKEYLEISMKYIKNILKRGLIDEYHIWIYTSDKNNTDYMLEIGNIHKTSNIFTDYKNTNAKIINNAFDVTIEGGSNAYILINEIYEIYIHHLNDNEAIISIKDIKNNIKIGNNTFKYIDYKYNGNYIRRKNKGIAYNITISIIPNKLKKKSNMEVKYNDAFILNINLNEHKDYKINNIKIHQDCQKEPLLWSYQSIVDSRIKVFDTMIRSEHGFKFGEFFKFYVNYDINYDVIFRADDDVVFFDINRLKEAINYCLNHPEVRTLFPNMINERMSVFYNLKNNLLPKNIMDKKYSYYSFENNKHICNYFLSGKDSILVLNHFLSNINSYINNTMKVQKIDYHILSVCSYIMTKYAFDRTYEAKFSYFCDVCKMYDFYKDKEECPCGNFPFSEEPFLFRHSHNYFYPRFVVSHFAYGPQRKSGLPSKYFVEKFKNISIIMNK